MIAERVYSLARAVKTVCERVGRTTDDITVILVTKTVAVERIIEAYRAGIHDFGENKVQEFVKKQEELPTDIRWHFVGHLQTNKVKYIIDKVALIHSVDRIAVAQEIEKQALKHNRIVDVLIQVNTSHEETKFGASEEEVERLVREISALSHIRIKGLMTIGPFTDNVIIIRECFRKLRSVREILQKRFASIDFAFLSMGMSADYAIALEEGANMLRIGTAVFGERMR